MRRHPSCHAEPTGHTGRTFEISEAKVISGSRIFSFVFYHTILLQARVHEFLWRERFPTVTSGGKNKSQKNEINHSPPPPPLPPFFLMRGEQLNLLFDKLPTTPYGDQAVS